MTRSLYKPDFISKDVFRKISNKTTESLSIKTRSRSTVITSEMMGMEYVVHNGKIFIRFNVSHPSMIGHRLGEFSYTKRMGNYLHKKAHTERVRKKKQKLLAQKQSKKKIKKKK